jgi:hypothetical protein
MTALSTPANFCTLATDPRSPNHPDGLGLVAHVRACEQALGRTFGLRCVAERLHEWLGPRLCTMVFGVTALMVLAGSLY